MSGQAPRPWSIGGGRCLELDRPRLMGIVNVTPDSFHAGSRVPDAREAVERALAMVEQGVEIVDVGGESTRPGAERIGAEEQVRRVVPVVAGIAERSDVAISIDTTCADVAEAALDAGATIINDVAAGREDPGMLDLAASRGCGLVLMHRLRPPGGDRYSDQYDRPPHYDDVTQTVRDFLAERAAAVVAAGVDPAAIVLDPGLGFGKTVGQNYRLIRDTSRLLELGHPLLSAASRKSFVGDPSGARDPADRLPGSLAVSVVHFLAGVRLFRVHDVGAHRQALAVAAAAG